MTEPDTISLDEIRALAEARFGDLIKGVSMTEWQHHDAARWWNLSLAEQFGNVGSEVSRAIRWSTKNPATAQAALYRGLELFDLMLDDPRHRRSVARLREIARAREVVVDFLAGSNEYRSTGSSLQKYFDQFALAARRAHAAG